MRSYSLLRLAASSAALLLSAMTLIFAPSSLPAQDEVTAKENDPLTTYRNTNRVLLVFAPVGSDPQYTKQLSELTDKAALKERQIIVLPVLADDKAAGKSLPFLQTKFNDGKPTFSLVLVGKDGNAAYRSAEPVTAEAIYAKIDAMPMRKEEVKEKKKSESNNESGGSKKSNPDKEE